ncbi:MAG TPA: FkbM family methyltransferase [Stellaceae bacterium]|nr:FkbM family methyltransferase [Stellaceae bacterium]
MSKTLARIVAAGGRMVTRWHTPYRRAMALAEASRLMRPLWQVETQAGPLVFEASSGRALIDPAHLYTAEPETIRWIDGLAPDERLWDIGANVGTYALYAAKRGLDVMAFEPSAATYANMMRNIELSRLGGRIKALCLAFDSHNHLERLRMASTEAGHSMHAFGQNETVLRVLKDPHEQWVLGYGIDAFIAQFQVPPPDHIKLDVDSIEEKILAGATQTLKGVRSVMVEIDGGVRDAGGAGIRRLLAEAGLEEDRDMVSAERRNVLFRRPEGALAAV